jgi:hypothetical protein
MSGPRAFVEYLWANSDSIIAESDAEFMRVVSNLYFNFFSIRMAERIAQNLTANSVDFVLKSPLYVSRRSFDGQAENRAAAARNINTRKFLPGSRKQMSQFARSR